MKPGITVTLLLLLFFGCNSRSKSNQSSETQQETELLLENETDMEPDNDWLYEDDDAVEFPNAQYAGKYIFGSEDDDDTYGSVSLLCQVGYAMSFDLYFGTRAPTYKSGNLSGEVRIRDGKGRFRKGDCILEFTLDGNSVTVSHGEGGFKCGFDDSLYINNTFVREQAEIPPPSTGDISEEMLWDIFMLIPEDSITDFEKFSTKQQRRLAKINQQLKLAYYCDNHLEYNGFTGEGFSRFMGLAGYLTEDKEKIVALFYYGGSVDINETYSKQTYEYDISTDRKSVV